MKSILLLTDFSDSANNAIHYAMHFFKSDSCVFHVMHVHKAGSFITDDLMTTPTENIYESITRIPEQKLKSLIKHLKDEYHNEEHSFNIIIDFDVFTDAIKQIVEANSIDIIVLGSNGKTGAKEVLFGSNTINVIKHVSCKTMVIPTDYKFKPIQNFLLPLQCNDIINSEQLYTIEDFYKFNNFKFHILRVCKNEKSKVKYDLNHLEGLDWTYSIDDRKNFFDAVTSYLKENSIDMTSLIIRDQSFIMRFLTETPVLELSKVIKLPLLIFHI